MSAAQRAVCHRGGPLLVLGGPGTGKTGSLEQRYLDLAVSDGAHPHQILLLCSSRSYAVGARERLARQLPHQATVEVPVYTWHGLAYHLVTRYYPRLGFARMPVLLTAAEQWGTVHELLGIQDPAGWPVWGERLEERAFCDEVADFCLRVEQQLIPQEQLNSIAAEHADWAEVVHFAGIYRAHLLERARVDYAQLISGAARLLEEDAGVRQDLRRKFPQVMVDDGQDLSRAQLRMLSRLETSHLVLAADPDSGIESFRGAQPDWVFGFEQWFGPAGVEVLTNHRRIGAPLAGALKNLIRHNDAGSEHWATVNAPHRTDFECRQYSSMVEEMDAVAHELRRAHVVDGIQWSELAVLISQPRYLLGPLQRSLELCDIPYQPLEGERPLTQEPAVGCFLDLARVALRVDSHTRSLARLLTGPLGGMDLAGRRELEREAWRSGKALLDVALESPATAELAKLTELVVAYQDRADECFWEVYSAARYYRDLEAKALADPGDPANASVDALVAFSHGLSRFVQRRSGRGSVPEYLSEASGADFGADAWMPSGAQRRDGVCISTFHGAKGREWEAVMVAGCLDAWIPKRRRGRGTFDTYALETGSAIGRELEAIAEDRRTFYVAASRARSRVVFTASPHAGAKARPSRFLLELAGGPPVESDLTDLPALTLSEHEAGLRRCLADDGALVEEKVAATAALAEIPGVDPSYWYGQPDWTEAATPVVSGKLRTSYSRLSVYENCGLQYALQAVLGLDPASTYSMKFGTWVHALFEAVHRGLIDTSEHLKREYERLFDPGVFPNSTISRQFHRDGMRMLEVFWRYEAGATNVESERFFEFEYAGAVLRGRIDRIDRKNKTLKLTDYKTSKWAPSFKEAQSSLQLAIYHLAAREVPEIVEMGVPMVARLVYPGAFDRDGRYKVLSQNAEDADGVIAKLPQIVSSVAAEEFAPNPEADCYFCKMKPLCPLYPEGASVE
ncbi:MAG: ATP-dependent DNA helicase [Actinomycetota bacterium]